MRIVFHVGVHKTASTLIQDALTKNADWLQSKGVFYLDSHAPETHILHRNVMRRVQNPSRATPSSDVLIKINRRMIRMARHASAETVAISDENRIGVPPFRSLTFGHRRAKYYPDATNLLTMALRGLEEIETEFILYIRDFRTWLPSIYSEALRSLAIAMSFEEFLERIDFDTLDNVGLQQRILQVRPEAKIYLKQFEDIKLGAESYQRDFVRHIVSTTESFSPLNQIARPSLDKTQLEELLALAKRKEAHGMTRQIKRKRDAILSSQPNPDERLIMPAWAEDRLHSLYVQH